MGRLPESLDCTTDYRHETAAARRDAPARDPASPRPTPPARGLPLRDIDSFTPYTIIHRNRRARRHHVSARHVLVDTPAPRDTPARPSTSAPPRPPARSRRPPTYRLKLFFFPHFSSWFLYCKFFMKSTFDCILKYFAIFPKNILI